MIDVTLLLRPHLVSSPARRSRTRYRKGPSLTSAHGTTQAETSQLIQSAIISPVEYTEWPITRNLRAAGGEEKKQANQSPPALHQMSTVYGEHR